MKRLWPAHPSSFILHPFLLLLALALSCAPHEPRSRVVVVDDLGRNVAVPRQVVRVITLAPNLTEIVWALGSGDKLVGLEDNSDYPPQVTKLPRVGGMQ